MKKYISKSLILILLLSIFSARLGFSGAKYSYYKAVFKNWGIDIAGENEATRGVGVPSSLLLLISSEGVIFDDIVYGWILLVCDSEFEVSDGFWCNSTEVRGLEHVYENVYSGKIQGKHVIVIPEIALYTPHLKDKVENYFRALSHSGKVQLDTTSLSRARQSLFSEHRDNLLEVAKYVVCVFLLFIVYRNYKRLLDKRLYFKLVESTVVFLEEIRSICIFFLIFLLSTYVSLILLISLRDTKEISVSYILSYLSATNLFIERSPVRIFLVLLAYMIVVLATLVAISLLYRLITRYVRNHFDRFKIKSPMRIPLIVLIIFSMAACLGFSIERIYLPVSFLILLVMYVFYSLYAGGADFAEIFSKKERTMLLGFSTIVFLFGLAYKIGEQNKPPEVVYKDLIGIKDSIVMLPYSKDREKNDLFNEYILDIPFTVFVDNYLVYHPSYSSIRFKPISEFDISENYLVMKMERGELAKGIVQNEDFRRALSVLEFTPNLYVDIEDYSIDLDIDLRFIFNCVEKNESSKIWLKLSGENIDPILNFPGCDPKEGEESKVVYRVPWFGNKKFSGAGVLRFINTLTIGLVSIEVFVNGDKLDVQPLYLGGNDKVLVESHQSEGDVLYVYVQSADQVKGISFERVGEFDLAEVINMLINGGLVGEKFTIWSTSERALIRGSFNE